MIIKLPFYDGKYRVVSLAKNIAARDNLLQKKLDTVFFAENKLFFLPDSFTVELNEECINAFLDACNYDVFEISASGHAYKYYDNKSSDNAILVTNSCNSNCIMCPTADSVRKRNEKYSGEELVNIAKHIPSDSPHITITGGEPFLIKKDMFVLLDFLKENLSEIPYLLLTNARAFCIREYTELFKSTAPPNIELGIPLHGYNPETHDFITRAPGSFVQTCVGLKNLLRIGADIELRIVVSRLNMEFLTEIAELIASDFKGVKCVKFIGLEMTGNAAKNKESVWIDYPTAFGKSKHAIDILIESQIDVGIYNFPLCSVERRYRSLCEKSISPNKIRFAPQCDNCFVKDACGGIFSGTIRLAKNDILPIERKNI